MAVHRQLLRKYSNQEIENIEFKKKLELRDRRIKQLDRNLEEQRDALRLQNERHIAEVAGLFDQYQVSVFTR